MLHDGGWFDYACVWIVGNWWWRAQQLTDGDNTGKTAASGFVLLARRGEGVSVFMFLG